MREAERYAAGLQEVDHAGDGFVLGLAEGVVPVLEFVGGHDVGHAFNMMSSAYYVKCMKTPAVARVSAVERRRSAGFDDRLDGAQRRGALMLGEPEVVRLLQVQPDCGVVRSAFPRRRAVSAVIARRRATISVILFVGTSCAALRWRSRGRPHGSGEMGHGFGR